MPDTSPDPSGNTEQFRAFVQRDTEAQPVRRSNTAMIIIVSVVVVVVAAVAIYLLAS